MTAAVEQQIKGVFVVAAVLCFRVDAIIVFQKGIRPIYLVDYCRIDRYNWNERSTRVVALFISCVSMHRESFNLRTKSTNFSFSTVESMKLSKIFFR